MPISGDFEGREDRAAGAAEQCTEMLRNAIVTGEFPPGLRLPSERELAVRFRVGRVTVRNALARIEAEHLVTVRQGSGYFVRDFRRHAGPDLIGTLAALATRSADRIEIMSDLLLVRRQLAGAVVERLAAVVAEDPRALDGAAEAVARFEAVARSKRPTLAALADADLEVVAQLVAASKSAVLQLCFNPVAALLRDLPALQAAMYREPLGNAAAFAGLLEVLQRGRGNVAPALVESLAQRDAATIAYLTNDNAKKKKKS